MKSIWKLTILPALAALLITPALRAQSGDDAARDAYNQGRRYFDEGDYLKAADEFRRAYDLMPSWKIRYNIGQCEAAAKRYGLAIEAFEAYLVEGGDELTPDREEMVAKEIESLRARIGGIELKAPAGAEVIVDGALRGTTPLPGLLRINAGIVQKLVLKKGDEILMSRDVRVGSGETLVVEYVPETSATPAPVAVAEEKEGPKTIVLTETVEKTVEKPVPQEPSQKEEPSAQSGASADVAKSVGLAVGGWTLLATGIAAGIGGGIAGGLAIAKNSELESTCDASTNVCPADAKDIRDDARLMGNLSTVLLPTAAALAATGIVLLIVNSRRGKKADKPAAFLRAPQIAPFFTGFAVSGEF
jgi:hypothetical protein